MPSLTACPHALQTPLAVGALQKAAYDVHAFALCGTRLQRALAADSLSVMQAGSPHPCNEVAATRDDRSVV
jgi:hypothetical protein